MKMLNERIIEIYKETSRKLTGSDRRRFQAQITIEYLEGKARKAERIFGWYREAVSLGIKELETGYICYVEIHPRGRRKTEEKSAKLEQDIRELVDRNSQTDPKFQSPIMYTRMTARAVRKALIDCQGYTDEELPTERAIRNIINRLGYSLKPVEKAKPLKKIKETDAIFANVHTINKAADKAANTLRISIDTKAKVNIGEFSRNGKARDKEGVKACDHDMNPDEKLVPFGILEPMSAQLTTIVGNSFETSDFIVDALEIWWEERKERYPEIEELVINLDNGPSVSGTRTQFLKRMLEFSEKTGLRIHLVYYPPYHSKYNPIERCWGVLEKHWNGTILNSAEKALAWIETMTWKGIKPVVKFLNKAYEKGIKLTKKEMKKYDANIERSKTLPRWDISIEGASG